MEKTKKPKLFFEKTINVFAWLCLVLAVILAIISATAVISGENNGKEILGHKILIVNTDSMSKSAMSEDEKIFFNAGDIIIIRMITNPNELKEGDVISFFSYNPESMGKTVTHKIRKINYSSSGEITGIVTYGINTGVNDIVEVKPEHLVGKYVSKVPAVGLLFSFMKTPRGFYLSILIPGVLLIIFFSVKVGKILGKRELAKEYSDEINSLKDKDKILEGQNNTLLAGVGIAGGTSLQDEQLTLEENKEQNMEENVQQTTQQAQGQTAPTIYQTVTINCPSPMMSQPVVYQTAPSQTGSTICQTVSMTPQPVAYQMPIMTMPIPYQPVPVQSAPVAYQAVPVQPAPVVCQTIGENAAPVTPVSVQPNYAPTVCQTIGENGKPTMPQPVAYQTVPVQPIQLYQPVAVQPMTVQPQPVAPASAQTQAPIEPIKEETSATTVEEPEINKEEEITVTEEENIVVKEEQPKEEFVAEEVKEEVAITELEETSAIETEEESVIEQSELDSDMEDEESKNKLNIPEGEKKPFTEKLVNAKEETQNYFNVVHNELVSYKKVSSRVSFRCVSYRKGRTLLAKIGLRGKTLTGYFNLDVKDFNDKVFFQKDMSGVKAYEEVPFAVKIRSERACNNATKLVGAVAEKFELKKNPKFEAVDQVKQFRDEK